MAGQVHGNPVRLLSRLLLLLLLNEMSLRLLLLDHLELLMVVGVGMVVVRVVVVSRCGGGRAGGQLGGHLAGHGHHWAD